MTQTMTQTETMTVAPRLPENWRVLLAAARRQGVPDTPNHRRAFHSFVRHCFPAHVNTTDLDVREQIRAWWVLYQLPRCAWRYWLTAPAPKARKAVRS